MRRRTVLIFSILFLILAVSFLYYALPNILFPLRIDPMPDGAYVIPWMRPNPSIPLLWHPWVIDTVMTGALKLNMTFRIAIPGETRVVPSTVYVGHDEEYLYVGANFTGIGRNPYTNAQAYYGAYFNIHFDVDNSGQLTFPEAGSTLEAVVPPPENHTMHNYDSPIIYYYMDNVWENYMATVRRGAWDFAGNAGMPVQTHGDMVAEYDNGTGTLVVLYARHLWKDGYYSNSLQMRPGECWVMGFMLELGFMNPFGDTYEDRNHYDGWPRNAFPYLTNDASWWPKLAIDLTKQPTTFPGQTPTSTNASTSRYELKH